jgi:hypothetical protein
MLHATLKNETVIFSKVWYLSTNYTLSYLTTLEYLQFIIMILKMNTRMNVLIQYVTSSPWTTALQDKRNTKLNFENCIKIK